MKALRKLQPGQAGTKKLAKKYGDDLVCVRYRYDLENKKRLTTVELIIEEQPWQPQANRIPMNKKVQLRIEYGEFDIRTKVKAVGGKWNRKQKVWELSYHEVLKLGLKDRIIFADQATD